MGYGFQKTGDPHFWVVRQVKVFILRSPISEAPSWPLSLGLEEQVQVWCATPPTDSAVFPALTIGGWGASNHAREVRD